MVPSPGASRLLWFILLGYCALTYSYGLMSPPPYHYQSARLRSAEPCGTKPLMLSAVVLRAEGDSGGGHASNRLQHIAKIPMMVSMTLIGRAADAAGEVAAPPKYYMKQLEEAIPVKTLRGIWRILELKEGSNTVCKGRLKFRGFVDEPNKGKSIDDWRVWELAVFFWATRPPIRHALVSPANLLTGVAEYSGCSERKGRGIWLLKPAKISNGQVQFSARWKIRYNDGSATIYRGDVVAGGNYARADASIVDGEILEPYVGFAGGLSERRIGSFTADRIEQIDDLEKL